MLKNTVFAQSLRHYPNIIKIYRDPPLETTQKRICWDEASEVIDRWDFFAVKNVKIPLVTLTGKGTNPALHIRRSQQKPAQRYDFVNPKTLSALSSRVSPQAITHPTLNYLEPSLN